MARPAVTVPGHPCFLKSGKTLPRSSGEELGSSCASKGAGILKSSKLKMDAHLGGASPKGRGRTCCSQEVKYLIWTHRDPRPREPIACLPLASQTSRAEPLRRRRGFGEHKTPQIPLPPPIGRGCENKLCMAGACHRAHPEKLTVPRT